MSDHRDQFDERLERYLDGTLPPEDRAAFEQEMADDEDVAAAVALQDRIDASLRQLFTPPAAATLTPPREERLALNGLGRGAAPRPTAAPAPRRPALRWAALAAALALAVVGAWQIGRALQPSPSGAYGPWRSFAELHRDAGTERLPYWVCEDEQEFADTFRRRLGRAFVLDELPEGVEALGLAYCHSLSRDTIGLVGRARGERVLVLVDRLRRDQRAALPAGSGLRLFRLVWDDLVLYEVTPLEEPLLLPSLRDRRQDRAGGDLAIEEIEG